MNTVTPFHPASPLLSFCPPTLPGNWYLDAEHFKREQSDIHGKSWIYAGRVNDLPPLTMRRVQIAGQNLFLVKDETGEVRCFHNTCRHRGSELCVHQNTKLKAKMISCPYHDWGYDLAGALVRVPHVGETPGFDKSQNNLFAACVNIWNGFIYVCLSDTPPDFALAPDLGIASLQNWPMADLVTGHSLTKTLQCNWKVFWENYNECLHCPGIHPNLCEMVPVYKQGVMSAREALDWTPDANVDPVLREGAKTWTVNGQPCGAEFAGLSEEQRQAGHLFVTLMPTMYIVAHVDYVRVVSLRPVAPEVTELTAEWLFTSETLDAKNFNRDNVVDFANTVMMEDGAACELNQRGFHSKRYTQGTLMPQEFDVFNFHQWLRRKLGKPLYTPEAAS
jgi:glycine betaine catabolism A